MTETKQPDALRLAETLEALGDYNFATEAAAELRRQNAEIESLRAKLDELEEQEPLAFVLQSIADGSIFKSVVAMVGWSSFKRDLNALETDPWVKAGRARIIPLYLAAGAREEGANLTKAVAALKNISNDNWPDAARNAIVPQAAAEFIAAYMQSIGARQRLAAA